MISMDAPKQSRTGIGWKSVDWTRTNKEIARELRVLPSTAWLRRGTHGHPFTVRSAWLDVDWSLPDAAIARQMRVSKQAVNVRRRQRNPVPPETSPVARRKMKVIRQRSAPPPAKHSGKARARKMGLLWSEVNWARTNDVIAAEMGVTASTVRNWRHQLNERSRERRLGLRDAPDMKA